jgi:hypothetical protein
MKSAYGKVASGGAVLLALLIGLGLACGGSDADEDEDHGQEALAPSLPSSSDSSSGSSSSSTAAKYEKEVADCAAGASPPDPHCALRLAAQASCDKIEQCCMPGDRARGYRLDSRCLSSPIVNLDYEYGAVTSQVQAGTTSWDGQGFVDCLKMAADCANQKDPLDCIAPNVAGTRGEGESCTGDFACKSGLSCFTGDEANLQGTCRPLSPAGGACDSQPDCATVGTCSFIDHTCGKTIAGNEYAPNGARCQRGDDCQSNDCQDSMLCVERRVCFALSR